MLEEAKAADGAELISFIRKMDAEPRKPGNY